MPSATIPKPSPPLKPLGCASKARFTSVTTALKALAGIEDPYMHLFVCPQHACLHMGHSPLRSSFYTWDAAMRGVAQIQRQQSRPRRMRVSKTGTGARPWRIDWSKQT